MGPGHQRYFIKNIKNKNSDHDHSALSKRHDNNYRRPVRRAGLYVYILCAYSPARTEVD